MASLADEKDQSTVVRVYVGGASAADIQQALADGEELVQKRINSIISKCKRKGGKFEDEDFGPSDEDEFGSCAIYRGGKV